MVGRYYYVGKVGKLPWVPRIEQGKTVGRVTSLGRVKDPGYLLYQAPPNLLPNPILAT